MARLLSLALLVPLAACAGATTTPPSTSGTAPVSAPAPTVVQPGAPGEASRVVDARNVDELDMPGWTEADAEFMAGMIHHHAQALQMTALIDERSRNPGVSQMGLRMEISQRDEIRLMRDWLLARGLEAVDVVLEEGPSQGMMKGMADHAAMGHAMGGGMDGGLMEMPGMLSPEQMQRLRESEGDTFDQLFLEYMIQHHTGAITMVEKLMSTPGAAQESMVNQFAVDIDSDQSAEIDRMRMLLAQYR